MHEKINHHLDPIDWSKNKPSLQVTITESKSRLRVHGTIKKANKSIKKLSRILLSRVFAHKSTGNDDTAPNFNSLSSMLGKDNQKANTQSLNAISEKEHEFLTDYSVLSNEFAYRNFDWEKEGDDKILDSPVVTFRSSFE